MTKPVVPIQGDRLEPCPFCGGRGGLGSRSYKTKRTSGVQHGFTAHCMNPGCHAVVAGFESFDTEAEAITAWNTRTSSTAELLEALEEILPRYVTLLAEVDSSPEQNSDVFNARRVIARAKGGAS